MRAGYKLSGFDVSVFVTNLLDEAEWAGRRQRDNGLATIYRSHIVRPRTLGITVGYDF